jgi:hypothetical protein
MYVQEAAVFFLEQFEHGDLASHRFFESLQFVQAVAALCLFSGLILGRGMVGELSSKH